MKIDHSFFLFDISIVQKLLEGVPQLRVAFRGGGGQAEFHPISRGKEGISANIKNFSARNCKIARKLG